MIASKDGVLSKLNNVRSANDPQYVEFITCCPDTLFSVGPKLPPRFGPGMINKSYQKLFKAYLGFDMKITEYGKPHDNTFDFVENTILNSHPGIKTCYMVGDNLSTDIKGANDRNKVSQKMKWVSIAVKTGIF